MKIREPQQTRAIEKKSQIIEAGVRLFCEHGYNQVNTADIAKEAGVSTGIVYQYFRDKHDILIAGLERSFELFYPTLQFPSKQLDANNFGSVLRDLIMKYITEHKMSQKAHEEITVMIHIDPDVADFFHQKELETTKQLAQRLKSLGIKTSNLLEKTHIMLGLIEDLCHEIVYHRHTEIDYKITTDIVIRQIEALFYNKGN